MIKKVLNWFNIIDNIYLTFYILILGHRIGIGNGFCDLEFVILSTMKMVTDNTVVVTIVHDAQVMYKIIC